MRLSHQAINRARKRLRKDLAMAPASSLFSKGGQAVDIQPPFHFGKVTVNSEVSRGDCEICPIHPADPGGPVTLQINVRSGCNLYFWWSLWDMISKWLCKHTNIGGELRERLSLANFSSLTPPSTSEALVLDLVVSQFTCGVNEQAPLAVATRWASTAVQELDKSFHWGLTDSGCSGKISPCKRHEFGTVFSTGADGCVASLHNYRFSLTRQKQKVTGKHHS